MKTKQCARECIWFPEIDRKLTIAVKEYLPCKAVTTNTRQQEPFRMTELPNGPWKHLRADLFGQLPSKEYVLVVQCLYSYFSAIEIVTSTSTSSIIPAMDMIMTNFSIPNKLGTDNGPPFNSQDFANFAKHMGFKHTTVTPYTPWENNMVEHFMRNLGKSSKHHTSMITSVRQPFNVSFVLTEPWQTLLRCTHQFSFYSTTDNTKLDCPTQQSSQTCFDTRKSKKTTNARN